MKKTIQAITLTLSAVALIGLSSCASIETPAGKCCGSEGACCKTCTSDDHTGHDHGHAH